MGGDSKSSDQGSAYDAWKGHCGGVRINTELTVFEFLRKTHPDYHVTRTLPMKSDFIGFAAAGHATAVLEDNEDWDGSRNYKDPPARPANQLGTLENQFNFGRYQYQWQGKNFLLYQLECERMYGGIVKCNFLLAPRPQGVSQQRHHPATDELLMAVGAWTSTPTKELYVFDDGRWTKDQNLWKSVQNSSWEDVILEPGMKANLIKDVTGFFKNKPLYRKLGVPWKRGIIMHGVPGNGKTLSIKALINSLTSLPVPVPALYVKSFDARNGPKRAIRSIFVHARTHAPCLLIFEDLDSLVEDSVRSYFLNEVDGLESNDGILMIGSTNHLNSLDPAISKRPSRFDRKYHFKIPGEEERATFSEMWRHKIGDGDMVDFTAELSPIIAKMTERFSFAYMQELFVMTLLGIAHENEADMEIVPSSGSSSTGDAVMVEPEENTADPEKPAEDSQALVKKSASEVEIPDSLQENRFLKAIQVQAKTLLSEMDNTQDE